MAKNIMITGAAGYIGAMMVDVYAGRDDVGTILAIDKEPEPNFLKNKYNKNKIVYLQANLADNDWVLLAQQIKPEIIIHAAWQIREIYGRRDLSWRYNITASDKVFDFAFSHDYVNRLIHFSTVASYGALSTNDINYKYKETDKLRETVYLYAEEKRIAERHLAQKYTEYIDRTTTTISNILEKNINKSVVENKHEENTEKRVMIIRPASITGPRLRNDMNKFSLQSALSGKLKKQKGILNKIVGNMTSFMPATHGWLRQYIHEDDVTDIVAMLAFDNNINDRYEVYNICPPGPVMLATDMAKALGKKPININVRLIQLVFALFWHITRGRVPTAPGVWMGYSYPIGIDGSKINNKHNYGYQYESLEALTLDRGRYSKNVNPYEKLQCL